MQCCIIKGLLGCPRRVPTLSLYIMYGEIILIISTQEQIFPSLIQVSLSLLCWSLWGRQSPHLQQLQKYSTLPRGFVSNTIFTEEEREKWIHMLILQHWIHSIILQWVLHTLERHNSYWKHSLCKEKQSKAFAESKCFLLKYANFNTIILSFKM